METKARELDHDKLFQAYEEARADNTTHFRTIMELQKRVEDLEAEIKRLQSCCKDFEFVIEGSRAIKQPDSMLEKRENALMRALDWSNKKKAFGEVDR